MDKIEYLYSLSSFGFLRDKELAYLYKLDAETYDYENNKHNEKIEEILKSRNIREDLARLLQCDEHEIAFLNESMASDIKYLYTGVHVVNVKTHEVLNGKISDLKKYLDNIEKEKKEKVENNPEKIVNKLKKKSIIPGYAKRPYRPQNKNISKEHAKEKTDDAVKSLIIAGAIVGTIMMPMIFQGDNKLENFVNENRYIISNEKVRTDDNKGFYYLHNNIAKNILNSDQDHDALIYVAYVEIKKDAATLMGHNKEQIDYNMDLLMRDISFNSDDYDYSDFDSYLVSRNCVDQTGKANDNEYNKKMSEYIVNMLKDNNYSFDGGKVK